MAVPNRLAQEGEELVTHRFPTGSLGMASPGDVRAATAPRPASPQTIWQKIRAFLDPLAAPAVCAVCLPPGARLMLSEIPERLQLQWGVSSQEPVVFTQISAAVNSYRDAVRFENGREVRLQDMREGMHARVLDLSGTEVPSLEELHSLG